MLASFILCLLLLEHSLAKWPGCLQKLQVSLDLEPWVMEQNGARGHDARKDDYHCFRFDRQTQENKEKRMKENMTMRNERSHTWGQRTRCEEG
jgi:hypothetical protein